MTGSTNTRFLRMATPIQARVSQSNSKRAGIPVDREQRLSCALYPVTEEILSLASSMRSIDQLERYEGCRLPPPDQFREHPLSSEHEVGF